MKFELWFPFYVFGVSVTTVGLFFWRRERQSCPGAEGIYDQSKQGKGIGASALQALITRSGDGWMKGERRMDVAKRKREAAIEKE